MMKDEVGREGGWEGGRECAGRIIIQHSTNRALPDSDSRRYHVKTDSRNGTIIPPFDVPGEEGAGIFPEHFASFLPLSPLRGIGTTLPEPFFTVAANAGFLAICTSALMQRPRTVSDLLILFPSS